MSHKSPAELKQAAEETLVDLQRQETLKTRDRLAIPQQEMPAQLP
jgi:hypothetical protein